MVLHEVHIEAAGVTGWFSKPLVFGEDITQLYGPNGCGKTPVIQSIAFALGYPIKFREDVYKNCEAVWLRLSTGGQEVELRRRIDRRVDISARVDGGETQTFYDEKEYSKFLFGLFRVDTPSLTSTGNEATQPYLATFLPLFYLDQDVGYTSLYSAPGSFIKSQYAEMMRLALGLPPKHSFDQKRFVYEKKRQLDELDRAVVRHQQLLENLQGELGASRPSRAALEQKIASVRYEIESLKDGRSLADDAISAVNKLIRERQESYQTVESEIRELRTRVTGFERIKNEIEVEVSTLSLNEEARRLFESFKDICSNPQCGLFLGSAESYGKNLLYLRDQVKDLARNTTVQESRIEELESRLVTMRSEIAELDRTRQKMLVEEGIDAVIGAINELTGRMVELQKEKQVFDAIEAEESEYVRLLNERESVQKDLASLGGSSGTSDLRALELRRKIRERIVFWLDVLRTKNVSREVQVDADFGVQFGEEKITQFAGSTLLRVILAIRTACFEVYVEDEGNAFRFLILDTPRQQDIEAADLASYIQELKNVAVEHGAQVIFSTTEYHYEGTDGDVEWMPEFPGPEQPMFLGISANQS